MENEFVNRRWLVIPTSLTGSLNFDQIYQNSLESLRISIDGTKTFIKYDIEIIETPYTITHIDADTGEEFVENVEVGIYGRPDVYSDDYTEYNYSEI
jgi:hypothetical protein